LELLVDADGLGDVDATLDLGGVVELAECGVAGTGVVPRGGGLLGGAVQALEDHLGPARLELADHRTQGGAHDTRADEGDIDLVSDLGSVLVFGGHLALPHSSSKVLASTWPAPGVGTTPRRAGQFRVRALTSSAQIHSPCPVPINLTP